MLGFHGEVGSLNRPQMRRVRRNRNPKNTALPPTPGQTPNAFIAPRRTVRRSQRGGNMQSRNPTTPLPPAANVISNNFTTATQIQDKVARWRNQRKNKQDKQLVEPSSEDETVPPPVVKKDVPVPVNDSKSVQQEIKTSETNMVKLIEALEQQVQQLKMEQQKLNEKVQHVQVEQRSQQSQMDQSSSPNDKQIENIEERLRDERHEEFKMLESNLRTSLQEIHDNTMWVYGVCAKNVSIYSDPDLTSTLIGQYSERSKIVLVYPMRRNRTGVWMRTRTAEPNARLTSGWLPVFQFTPEVIQHYSKMNARPPENSEKIINVHQFSLTCC